MGKEIGTVHGFQNPDARIKEEVYLGEVHRNETLKNLSIGQNHVPGFLKT